MLHPVEGHVVLIDAARFFRGKDGYPKIARVRKLVRAAYPKALCEVENDIIRVVLR